MADLVNEFSWSRTRDNVFKECRRRYFYQYYGAWGGWDADADPLVRRLYVLKKLGTRQMWAGRLVHETIERAAVHPTALATDAQHVVETRLREEDQATAAITALEEMDLDSEGFEQAYRALMSDVLEHAEREEHEEFIHVGTFASERLALIARGMTIAEQGAQSLGGTTFEEMLSNASMALRQT